MKRRDFLKSAIAAMAVPTALVAAKSNQVHYDIMSHLSAEFEKYRTNNGTSPSLILIDNNFRDEYIKACGGKGESEDFVGSWFTHHHFRSSWVEFVDSKDMYGWISRMLNEKEKDEYCQLQLIKVMKKCCANMEKNSKENFNKEFFIVSPKMLDIYQTLLA